MTDQNLTELVCIIDRSGSMQSIRGDAIGGFNTFLEEQKKIKGDRCLFTFTQFDNEYEVVHDGKPIEDIPPLTEATYVPGGSTALLDAIGQTLNTVGARFANTPEEQRPGRVAVVILTDGRENASKEFNHGKILEMIKTQSEQFKWEFIYLAAGKDAFDAGHHLGIRNVSQFSHDAAGARGIQRNMSAAVCSYRSSGIMGKTEGAISDSNKPK